MSTEELTDEQMVSEYRKMTRQLYKKLVKALRRVSTLEDELGVANKDLEWYEQDGD